jgi:hypothetical protein
MILLYTGLLIVLAVAGFLVRRRVAGLERKYTHIAKAVQRLALEPAYKGGTNRLDACAIAKRQYQLGQLAQKRDRIEGKYHAWQGFADRYHGFVSRVQGWNGKKLPYTFGVLDVSAVLYGVDYLGASRHVNLASAWHWITTMISSQ